MAKKPKVPATWLYMLGKTVLYPFYKLVYRIHVVGAENVPREGRLLLCSNHLAKKDPLLIGVMLRRQIFYMGKAELFESKFLGGLLRMLGVFPVERGTGGADALQNAYDLLERGALVGIFIEGTRSKTGELGRPKTGAAMLAYETDTPVIPVCITGDTGSFCKPFHRSEIRFGAPMSPAQLGLTEHSGPAMRRGSRAVMEEIARMREQSRASFGLPALPASEARKGEAEK